MNESIAGGGRAASALAKKVSVVLLPEAGDGVYIPKAESCPSTTQPREPSVSEKIILLLAANPKEAAPLRLDDELREIRRSLRGAKLRDNFRLEVVTSARQKDIRQALLDHKPYVVHFSGHGSDDAEILILKDDGSPQFVGAGTLEPFFEIFSTHVRCVVLNSCYTQPLAEKIGQYVSYVVGMKNTVKDEVAIQYAAAFYDVLFAGEAIAKAHGIGCNAIKWADLPGDLLPVLHTAEGASDEDLIATKPVSPMSEDQVNLWLCEVRRLYSRPRAAETLLSRIGFPRDHLPLYDVRNAVEFWAEVRALLVDGVVEGAGLDSLLQEARRDFPGNKVLKQALEG
jgi:hypothetical protein